MQDILCKNNDNYENILILSPLLEFDLEELISLCKTANGNVVKVFSQNVKQINPSVYVGYGKLEEVNEFIKDNNVDCVVFNGILSPSQTINLSEYLSDVKVIDKTTLILDIFAQNALSGEGKLQVELAQLKYIYPRLKGKGKGLSRLGGGIGTRGPGETQLETDRRHIKTRISYLEKAIEKLKNTRNLQKSNRVKRNIITVALVGYTNSGKSTLMNLLTNANVLAQDKLFATLDTKTANLFLNNFSVLLVDTVGFIKDIPTSIIEAFKSTLSVAIDADVILNVCDLTNDFEKQLSVTDSILSELGCASENIINVYNKCDAFFPDFLPNNAVVISAKSGYGIDRLKREIENKLSEKFSFINITVDYTKYDKIQKNKRFFERIEEEFSDETVKLKIVIKKEYLKVLDFIFE